MSCAGTAARLGGAGGRVLAAWVMQTQWPSQACGVPCGGCGSCAGMPCAYRASDDGIGIVMAPSWQGIAFGVTAWAAWPQQSPRVPAQAAPTPFATSARQSRACSSSERTGMGAVYARKERPAQPRRFCGQVTIARLGNMRVSISYDANWEAKLDHALRPLESMTDLEGRDYGAGLRTLFIVANCRSPDLQHKQRIRYRRNEAFLSMDVMLSLTDFVSATHVRRREMLVEALLQQVQRALEQRKIEFFDPDAFLSDFGVVLERDLLGPESARFDGLVLERACGY